MNEIEKLIDRYQNEKFFYTQGQIMLDDGAPSDMLLIYATTIQKLDEFIEELKQLNKKLYL